MGKVSHMVGLWGADMHIMLCSLHHKSRNSRRFGICGMRARTVS